MACGVPLIASDLTSLPELCGEAALWLREHSPEELCAALQRIEADSELRANLSAAGRARVERFTPAAAARRTVEIYLEAIDRPDPEALFRRQMFSQLLARHRSDAAP